MSARRPTKIKTLLMTGRNNHDWKRSAPFCRDLLMASGRFDVTLTETPWDVLAQPAEVAKYKLFFSDWNDSAEAVSPVARAAFESAVWGGAGVCILHAADNAFPGWVEYEKMVGLMWREGTGHGSYHEFDVKIRDHDHPITDGVEDFRTWDELYHRLVPMHDVSCRVLATAWSDPATGGTGNDEPMMVTTSYGKGRIFHQVLGHVWWVDPAAAAPDASRGMKSFENPGFQRTLLRGCEWAATGKVTLK
jgi:uncharacterized protein